MANPESRRALKRLLRFSWGTIWVIGAPTLLLTALITYYIYGALISPLRLAENRVPLEDIYWTITQYQVSLASFEKQAVRYTARIDPNREALGRSHEQLESKFEELATQSRQSDVISASVPTYFDALSLINWHMQRIALDMAAIPGDPNAQGRLLEQFDRMTWVVTGLANDVRVAESQQRNAAVADFYDKRQKLFIGALLIWTIFLAAIGLLLLNGRRARALIRQQTASLVREHEATKALQDAIMAKNTFLAMVSHELRTPLQSILSSIDLLALKNPCQKFDAVMKRLIGAAEQLEAQMKDLTDFARLDAGKLTLREVTFNLEELLINIVEGYRPLAEKKGLTLTHFIGPGLTAVRSDRCRFEQIANNLIVNAIKYTDSGIIKVSLRRTAGAADEVSLTVEDTGPGIPAEDLPTLFEPFTQVARARRHDGAGMGLSIVKRLVTLFNGTVQVHSNIGEGSRFDVLLPMAAVPGESEIRGPEKQTGTIPNHILVVDDNDDIRASFREMLEQLGYRCDVSANGRDALKLARLNRYQAILLDIQMPDMDGFEVAAAIQSMDEIHRPHAIIGISAYLPQFTTVEQRTIFSGYLVKPVRINELRQTLEHLLSEAV